MATEAAAAPPSYQRRFHLITEEITKNLPELAQCKTGLCYVFIQHASVSMTLNENADPNVCHDMETFSNHYIPENEEYSALELRYYGRLRSLFLKLIKHFQCNF